MLTEQLIEKIQEKIKSQDVMIQCLHEERVSLKRNKQKLASGGSPRASDSNRSQISPKRKAFNASMKPPVPGKRIHPGDFHEMSEYNQRVTSSPQAMSQLATRNDLNHSSIVDMKVRLNSAAGRASPRGATSRSMTRLPSHRSMKSQ